MTSFEIVYVPLHGDSEGSSGGPLSSRRISAENKAEAVIEFADSLQGDLADRPVVVNQGEAELSDDHVQTILGADVEYKRGPQPPEIAIESIEEAE